jgi:hypothetical protein
MEINFEAVRVRFPKANGHELDADEVTIPSLLANLIETPLNQRVAGQVLLETDQQHSHIGADFYLKKKW